MARVRRDADLGSRDARRRLKERREPYFRVLERGLSIGYRKSHEGGAWLARWYDAQTGRHFERRIGTSDDHRDADGAEVLDFAQAQRKVLAGAKRAAEEASGQYYTVADAVRDYLDYIRAHRKSADDAAIKLNAYAVPCLWDKRIAELIPGDFDEWLKLAVKRQQRRKPKKPRPEPKRRRKVMPQEPEEEAEASKAVPLDPEELRRRRKVTINRVINALKAALNHAHDRHKVATRDSWAKLRKFKGVDAARLRWLTEAEAKRLMNVAPPDLRELIQGGLMTGCRPGELARARGRDFDAQSETLLVPDTKTGTPRRVPLTTQGVALLDSLTARIQPDELIFTRADRSPWTRVAVIRGMQTASDAGKISPRATFYALRHTYASHLVQQGTPLLFVASALGHRDARMVEKHYGHFAPSHVAKMIKAKLPTFGIEVKTNVRTLKPKAKGSSGGSRGFGR
jgi:integrase